MSVILLFLGICGLLFFRPNKKIIVAIFCAVVVFAAAFFFPRIEYYDEGREIYILAHEQGRYGDIKILEIGNLRCVAQDGVAQSCVELPHLTAFPLFQNWAHIIHSANPSSVLVLGAGAGNLSSELSEKIPRVDLIDIDPTVIRLSREYLGFAPKSNQHLTIADARSFLHTTPYRYDIIFSDVALGDSIPTHIFTKEAFSLFAQRLAPGGIALLHIPGGVGHKDASMASILKTAQAVFPSVGLFTNRPDENISYLLYLSMDPAYITDPPASAMPWTPAIVQENLGTILTDNYNPLEVLWTEKNVLQLEATRRFGGIRSVLRCHKAKPKT